MPKRKKVVAASSGDARTADENLGSSSDDDSASLLDVEFEWFDPQEIDFHGLKLLLRQLLDADADLFDLSALTSLILSQPLLGSTVKVPEDGVATNMTDPFAFLTVLNLHTHRVSRSASVFVRPSHHAETRFFSSRRIDRRLRH